ncbi:hypothetical protein MOQ72_30030 [Saccharopolyspora sp. K220]|uniref:urease accessory protein UreF n=1 Tax=Saccharopolyspora soli TaxID=2926618 RepID=UPI001F5934A4|nr:urease accessory UreF family protein [Saccharopolyspora soli]MCI2421682.1 hypothetical protein [Saccharopolyspora soli]
MNVAEFVAALRFGDSGFPNGGFAFSSGLEGAHRDGWVTDEPDVLAFLGEQLRCRWHTSDRVLLRRAWAGPEEARRADQLAEALAVMSVLREASRRAGLAVLGTFAALGSTAAQTYRSAVLAGAAPGHLPVVLACCYRDGGLSPAAAEAISGWQVVSGVASAALRLGLVGHLGAQRVVGAAQPTLESLLSQRPPDEPTSFTAYADIAAQRRTSQPRLFAS